MAQRFTGFYLSLRDRRDSLDLFMWQFYSQLLKGLQLYQSHTVSVDGKLTKLSEELLVDKVAQQGLNTQFLEQDTDDEFILFRGTYIKAFQDGTVLFKILRSIVLTLGDTTAPLEAKRVQYRSEGKSFCNLRASYWFIDTNFVSQLPSDYEVAFTVDCLLYGEWRINHQNLVGLHLLALIWMLGVKQFQQFIPPGMRSCPQVTSPLFQHFLPKVGIQITYGDQVRPAADEKPAAAVAK